MSVAELIGDKLPNISNRIAYPQLLARVASGSLVGATIAVISKEKIVTGIFVGGTSALLGAFISFFSRKYLSKIPYIKNHLVGLLEDVAAIKLGISLMKT